jgi:UPF0755 protein
VRWAWLFVGVGLVVAAAVGAGVALTTLEPVDPESERKLVFVVSPGETLLAVAARLEDSGLVRSRLAFQLLARWRGAAELLQTGEYEFSPALAPDDILTRIVEGRVLTYEVVLPEGFTLTQIAERLAAAGLVDRGTFLATARDPQTARKLGVGGEDLEGYLFPETYRLPRGLSPVDVARVMVEQFLQVWREIEPLARSMDFSMKDVVTLASIVEKETGAPEERSIIASVFLNRMERGMRLETDPTVIYGIPDFDGNLRRQDLENGDNPYNTYKIRGLPPGPIASPGRDALRAVVEPARSDFLFFVSRNDGTHVFSRTYAEHTRAVERFQRGSRSR